MATRLLFSGFIFLAILSCLFSFGTTEITNSASNRQWQQITTDTFQGKNYTLVTDPVLKWAEAEESCRLENLILTKIETPELLKFHLELMGKAGASNVWIGATNLNRDEFVWIENEEPFPSFLWKSGEPNNLGGVEHFVHLYYSYNSTNDNSEEKIYPFTCKTRDPVEITTTTAETTTTTEITTTTEKDGFVGFCTSPGFSPDPNDCQKYRLCELNEVGDLWESVLTCPGSTIWCQEEAKCQSPEICPCFLFQ